MKRSDKYGDKFMITKAKISKEKKKELKLAVIEDEITEEMVILKGIDNYLKNRKKENQKNKKFCESGEEGLSTSPTH